jgi:preprotein translocase subunit SecA
VLEHPLLNRSIESAQKKVEGHNYSIRKRLLKYDDVLNQQREVIYGLRNEAMYTENPREIIFEMVFEEIQLRLDEAGAGGSLDSEALRGFMHWVNAHFPVAIHAEELDQRKVVELPAFIVERIRESYRQKEFVEEAGILRQLERYTIIRPIDRHWQDHLTEMEELRRSVGLRSYGQKDPLNEYKSEAFVYFEELMGRIRQDVAIGLFRSASNLDAFQNMLERLSKRARAMGPGTEAPSPSFQSSTSPTASKVSPPTRLPVPIRAVEAKVGRNDVCPCGSGKKYKKCCGRDA